MQMGRLPQLHSHKMGNMLQVVSGSSNGMICVWNATTGVNPSDGRSLIDWAPWFGQFCCILTGWAVDCLWLT
jgi:hypothetical protein